MNRTPITQPKADKHADRFLRRLDQHGVHYSMSRVFTPKWALPMRELKWVVLEVYSPTLKKSRFMFAPWGMVGRCG